MVATKISPKYKGDPSYEGNTPSMKLTLLQWGDLPTKKFQPKCVNKESSLEWCYFTQQGLTDLLYTNAKHLIQSGRIWIRVASLSLVSFCHLSDLLIGPTYILY